MLNSNGRPKQPYEEFGKYIKDLRKKAKLGGAEAIRELRLRNRQQLYHYESGRTLPSGPLLINLAKVYNAQPEEVLERAYWPQLILLPLVSIVNPSQLSKDFIEQLEQGLKETERQRLTRFIEDLLRERSAVGQR